MPLNSKQQLFAEEYLIDRNATQAAKRAGYSEKTAYSQGHDLLKNPEVQDYIQNRTREHLKSLNVTQEEVAQMYTRIIRHDPRKIYNKDGTMKHPKDWSDEEAFAMSGIDIDETTSRKRSGKKTSTSITIRAKKVRFLSRRDALADVAKMGGYDMPPNDPPPPPASSGTLTQDFDMSVFTDDELKILAKGFRRPKP